jgi:acetyl esterase
VLAAMQSGTVAMAPAEVEEHAIPGGPSEVISLVVVRPLEGNGSLPAVVYLHGGGWVLGDFGTHERLVRELSTQARAAIVFVNYTRSPEARFPTALEEAYATTRWVARRGAELGLDGTRLAIAGDGAGANLAAAVTLLAGERGEPAIRHQVLFSPITDSRLDTGSYQAFAEGYWLTRAAMARFWGAYAPDPATRAEPTVSPSRASLAQLRGLPPATVITAEVDILRDEGEAYARRLREAGVEVTATRYDGAIHDFVMLNALANTVAASAATAQAAQALKSALDR